MPYPEQDDYFNVEDFQNMMVSVDNLMKEISDSGSQISSDAEHLYNQTKAQMDNIQKRMNTFTALKDGSTTGDAELKDIRVAYDGKEYGNAGEAVREQASDIHKALFGAGASIWSKAKAESTKYVAETKGISILNERFTAAGVVTKISRGTFAENESTLNLDRECSAYIIEFEKNPGTVYMPSAETIKIVSTTRITFEANGNARCWIPVEKGQYLAVDSTATAYECEDKQVPYMLYDQANETLDFRGFGAPGSTKPVDPYSLALEYKLEYDMDDTGLAKQIDANKEAAALLNEDLADVRSEKIQDINLLYLQNEKLIRYGITIEIIDGYIKMYGTSTTNAHFKISNGLLAATVINDWFSGKIDGFSSGDSVIFFYVLKNGNSVPSVMLYDNGANDKIKITQTPIIKAINKAVSFIDIYCANGTTVDCTIGIQLELGTEAHEFIPCNKTFGQLNPDVKSIRMDEIEEKIELVTEGNNTNTNEIRKIEGKYLNLKRYNLFNKNGLTFGKYINDNGNIVNAGSNYWIGEKIEIKYGDIIYMQPYVLKCYVYKSDGTFLGRIGGNNTVKEISVNFENASYMIVGDNSAEAIRNNAYLSINHGIIDYKSYSDMYANHVQTKKGYVVAQDGSGDFKTISDAISFANSGDTIYIKDGSYEEMIDFNYKTLHLVGQSKHGTIIWNDTGKYATPPIWMCSGSLKNVTIYAKKDSTKEYAFDESESRRSYAIHLDSKYPDYAKVEIDNCIIISEWSDCIGAGNQKDNTVIDIHNCEFDARNERNACYKHHSDASAQISLKRNIFKSNYEYSVVFHNGKEGVQVIVNLNENAVKGFYNGTPSVYVLGDYNYGNSVASMNVFTNM